MRLRPPLTVVALIVGLHTADAATLRVPGTHPTIQDAVDAAQSGDTIAVSKGTYAPFTVVGKTDLTIKGTRKTVIDGAVIAAVVVQVQSSSRITLERLTLRYAIDRGIDIDASEQITVRRCKVTDAYDGLRAHASGGVLVERSRFSGIGNDAIDFSDDDLGGPAHDSQIRKSRFSDIGDDAIELEGENHFVEKNRITGALGSGIVLEDSAADATVRKNRMTNTGGDGIVITGTGHLLEQNTVDDAGDDGIVMEGSSGTLRRNRVRDAADNGIEVGMSAVVATYNLFERNQVLGAARYGFAIADGGSTFRRNRAMQNGVLDLLDTSGPGANLYEKNRFGTGDIP